MAKSKRWSVRSVITKNGKRLETGYVVREYISKNDQLNERGMETTKKYVVHPREFKITGLRKDGDGYIIEAHRKTFVDRNEWIVAVCTYTGLCGKISRNRATEVNFYLI